VAKNDKQKFQLRLPLDIYSKAAEASNRLGISMNAYIILALMEKLTNEKEPGKV
jgi:predicted HicB family RNase H-like nuclease